MNAARSSGLSACERRLHAPLDLRALRHALRPRHVRRRQLHGLVEAVAADLVVPRLLRPHQIHRAVGDDAIQPGAEVRPRLEPPQLPIGAKKAFLDHIFRILFVAGHPVGQPEDTPAVPLDERSERLAVALAGTGQDGCCFGRVHLSRLDGASLSWLARRERLEVEG